MSEAKSVLLMTRGALLELPKEEQEKIEAYRLRFRAIIDEDAGGDSAATGLALVAMEMQVENE